MANIKEIENCRKTYANMSDSDLIHITFQFVPYCENHIAAQQILDERRRASEEARHQEIQKKLEELKKPHKPSFYILIFSAIFAFVAAIAAVLSVPQLQKVFFGNLQSPKSEERLQISGPPSQMPKKEQPKK